jgi:formyl-CoA transferase
MQLCRKLDIPVTEIFSIDNIHEHSHVKSVNLFEEHDHPTEGRIVSIRPTALFAKTPCKIERPCPNIGEQTLEILSELGVDQAFIPKAAKK